MHFELEYDVGPAEFVAQHWAVNPDGLERFRNQQIRGSAWSVIVIGAALLASVEAKSSPLIFGFLCMLVYQLIQTFLYRRTYDKAVTSAFASRPPRRVTLLVDDRGILEKVEGIESFVPWVAVRSSVAAGQTLLIELKAGLWAIVPKSAFAQLGGTTYDQFLLALQSKAVPHRTIRDVS
jgi:hypothetical protein